MTPVPENEISVTALDRRFFRKKEEVKKTAVAILKILNSDARKRRGKKVSVDIYLASAALMKKLNARFSSDAKKGRSPDQKRRENKNHPADILSFEEPSDFIAPDSEYKKIGEIFLNVSEKSETKKLLVHGLLHLLGYTHKKEKEAVKMEKMEKTIINKIKI